MKSSSLPAQPPALPPSCSLVGAPPCCPPAPAGLCLVCVYAYGCPGWLQPGECDMRLPFHGCPCESGGQASHCVRVCMGVHAVFAAFPSTVSPHRTARGRRATLSGCLLGGGVWMRWAPTTSSSLSLGSGWGETSL